MSANAVRDRPARPAGPPTPGDSLRLERLAALTGVSEPALAAELEALRGGLAPGARPVLDEAVRVAEQTVNASAAGSPLPALAAVATEIARTPRNGRDPERRSRIVAARTLTVLGDRGLYSDPYGVEPVWPHAGMLILNPFLGCSFGCVYCFRAAEQHERPDWFLNGMPVRVRDDDEVLGRLATHPLLIPGSTRVGLHCATTEPFLPQVKESTFRLLEEIDARGLAREVMVITKFFLSRADVERLSALADVRVLLLLTFNAAPPEMEAMGAHPEVLRRRVETLDHLEAHAGERLLWGHYYRPIVQGWNDGDEQIREALRFGDRTGVTVIGGLKPIAGQAEYASARGLPVPPPADPGEKLLPPELVDKLVRTHAEMRLTSTLVGDQSCGLTLLLARARGKPVPNVEALAMYDAAGAGRAPRCFGRCPPDQLAACAQPPRPTRAAVRRAAAALAIDAEFTIDPGGVRLRPSSEAPSRAQVEALASALSYAVFVDGGGVAELGA